ncbi:MAG TPA: SusC/RagA family TonB-linked outer membrane protein [Gemmatimonadales bacterium]|nr:SusC/RagA family TonB-linked outer membrane protein [Gemmatimonadales bacterium]
MRFAISRTVLSLTAVFLALCARPAAAQQTATVQGTITDAASGAAIADARVTVAGTPLQSTTNVLGSYRIAGIQPGNVTLEIRRIGYKTLTTALTLAGGQDFTGNYSLNASVVQLEEIVVTGTAGDQRSRAQAATVAVLDVAGLRQVQPTPSVASDLQSRIPGVSVTSASGSSGTSAQIRVRGAASISLSNEPLLYVDGVRVTAQGAPQWFTGGQSYDRLNDIEPDDIESIEIVKGPAAATLYGADASAGVIQIITKRGRPGSGKFTQSLSFDYNAINRNFTPRTNFGLCSPGSVVDTLRVLCYGKAVNTLVSDNPLLREHAFRTGQMVGVNWSGRGGGQNYGYYSSLNHEKEEGVLPNNGFDRNSGRVNFNWVPTAKLTLDAGIGITVALADLPDNDNNIFGWLGNSHLGNPVTVTKDGSGNNGWFGNQRDVAAMKAIANQRQSHRMIGSFTANFAPLPNFTHRLTAGLDWVREEDRRFLPKNSRNSYPINTGQIQEDRRGIERQTLDYLGNFQHDLSPTLASNLSFGFQLVDTREEHVFATGEGLTVNSNDVVSGASLKSGGQDWTRQRSVGILGQWQVSLNNRLTGQVGLRYDNASSFGKNAQWVVLPKVGLSWVASEEPFWKVGAVNTLRLRAAWGSTGRIPGPGASLTTLQSLPYYDGTIVAPGAVPLNPGNPDLRFERGEEFEAGFDAGFMRDLIGVEITYFNKISRDLLVQRPLPPSSGYTGGGPGIGGFPFVNISELVNRGLEIGARAVPVNRPNLSWEIRLGANTLHNEVTDLGHGLDSIPPFGVLNRVQTGWQLGAWRTRKIVSIDTVTNIVRVTQSPVFAGNVLPTLEGNVSTNLTVMRNLRFYGLIDTKRGHKVRNFTDFFRETQLVRSDNRLDTLKLSKYERLRRYGNPTAGQPAFITDTTGSPMTVNEVQDAYIQDGTFIRLRELSVSYTMPQRWARLLRATTASVTLAGQNLAVWTKYEGYDPEVVSNALALFNRDDFFTQPPVRRYVIRMNVTF